MGCGCGGSTNEWTPATQAQAQADHAESADPNERIQALHEAQARRVWPGTWDGVRTPDGAAT